MKTKKPQRKQKIIYKLSEEKNIEITKVNFVKNQLIAKTPCENIGKSEITNKVPKTIETARTPIQGERKEEDAEIGKLNLVENELFEKRSHENIEKAVAINQIENAIQTVTVTLQNKTEGEM